jgi:hypothetical protein
MIPEKVIHHEEHRAHEEKPRNKKSTQQLTRTHAVAKLVHPFTSRRKEKPNKRQR